MTDGYDPSLFSPLAQVEDSSFWFRARNRLIVDFTSRYSHHGQSFLEVGCGTGYVLAALVNDCGFVGTGTELLEEGLVHARLRLPTSTLMQLDATRMTFNQEFDFVGAFDVIEHITDDIAALGGLYQAVRPGGYLIITVPQHRWLWGPSDEEAHHVRRYRRRELVSRVRSAGFIDLRCTSFVSLLLPVMVLARLKGRVFGNKSRTIEELTPPGMVNRAFEYCMSAERQLLRTGINLPVGGSLILIAQRPH
jgi:SAM-dependent methyltransferase